MQSHQISTCSQSSTPPFSREPTLPIKSNSSYKDQSLAGRIHYLQDLQGRWEAKEIDLGWKDKAKAIATIALGIFGIITGLAIVSASAILWSQAAIGLALFLTMRSAGALATMAGMVYLLILKLDEIKEVLSRPSLQQLQIELKDLTEKKP